MTESCKSPGITTTTTTSAGINTTTTTSAGINTTTTMSAGITTTTTMSPGITTTTTMSAGITTTTTTSPVPGVIITSGVKVKVFNLHTKKICQLPNLPGSDRFYHSQCGNLLCGGVYSLRSCLMLNPLTGDFTPTSVTLREGRLDHLCWDVEGENGPTLLMGGEYSGSERSTELVSSDGSSSSGNFTLRYDTETACGIKTQDKFVITGGIDYSSPDWALRRVTRYSRTGQTETLPQLKVGRWNHACGSYLTDEGDMVLLVTGGWQYSGSGVRYIYLAST